LGWTETARRAGRKIGAAETAGPTSYAYDNGGNLTGSTNGIETNNYNDAGPVRLRQRRRRRHRHL